MTLSLMSVPALAADLSTEADPSALSELADSSELESEPELDPTLEPEPTPTPQPEPEPDQESEETVPPASPDTPEASEPVPEQPAVDTSATSEEPTSQESSSETPVPEEPEESVIPQQSVLSEFDNVVIETKDPEIVNASYTINTTKRLITVSCTAGSNIRTNLNNALAKAKSVATADKPYTVKVPAGSYTVSAVLYIYSNTTLDLTGVTLSYTGTSGNLFITGNQATRDAGKGGYKDFVNITIKNGTLKGNTKSSNCMVRMGHGTNIKLSGVTFDNCYGAHQLEVAGINGLTIENCTFQNLYPPAGAKDSYEALELDVLANDRCFGDFIQDGTTLKNVTITGCTFSNCPRGIGCHNQLVGAYHTGINISNNRFDNIKDAAIFCTAFRDCTIENNTITNATRGIYFVSLRKNASSTYVKAGGKKFSGTIQRDMNTVIRNNSISVKQMSSASSWGHYGVMGIQLYGVSLSSAIKNNDSTYSESVPAGNYTMAGVTVSGNTVKTAGFGIYMEGVQSSTIKNNTLTYTGSAQNAYYGIYSRTQCSKNKLDSNKISGFSKYNIYVKSGTNATSISGNTLSKSGSVGIYVNGASAQTIQNNTITSSSGRGIYLSSVQANCNVANNTISGCVSHPIQLNSSTAYVMTLGGNVVKATSSTCAIYVSKGKISINQNPLSNGKYGIYTASGVTGNIFYNSLKNCTYNRYYIKGKTSYSVPNMTKPTLSSVSRSASRTMLVKWTKVSNATGYVIQYSTKSDMTNATKVTVTSGSTLSKTIKNLTAGKTYYVRVRSYHTYNSVKVYSAYSTIKTITA